MPSRWAGNHAAKHQCTNRHTNTSSQSLWWTEENSSAYVQMQTRVARAHSLQTHNINISCYCCKTKSKICSLILSFCGYWWGLLWFKGVFVYFNSGPLRVEEISENIIWIVFSKHFLSILSTSSLLDIRVHSSEATLLSSSALYHFPCFHLFSPSIFHSLPAMQYLFISPLLFLFMSVAACHHWKFVIAVISSIS